MSNKYGVIQLPSSALKICFFSDTTSYGGAEKYLEDLSRYFLLKGHECSFIVHKENIRFRAKLTEIGIPYVPLAFGKYYEIHYQVPIVNVFWKMKPDVLHINLPGPYNCSLVALTAKLSGIKTIIATEHLPMMPRWPKPAFVKKITTKCLDTSIVVSYENKKYLEKIHQINTKTVTVIQNGINLRKFTCDMFKDTRQCLRQAYGFSDRDLVFGIIGRLTVQKGHIFALKALSKIHLDATNIKILCVGEGKLESDLKKEVAELGIADKVVFSGFQKDMPAQYSCIDILLMPSLFEGLPLSLLEAMAMKKPALASKINGIPEVIDHNINGLLLPPEDTDAIANAMKRLYDDRNLISVWGEKSHSKIKNKFSLELMAKKTEEIYTTKHKQKNMEFRF